MNISRARIKLILNFIPGVLILLNLPVFSQVPQGFNYQAIARDGSGNPVLNATIKVRLSILSDTTGFFATGAGTYLWEEEQAIVKTNAFGLFTVVLGSPSATKIQGSANSFATIPWNTSPLFIGTKVANPSIYKNMGSAKLWSVPYSLVSGAVSGTLTKLSVKGNVVSPDSALFEVKNNNGQTVFAVYNEGVRIYVDNGVAKGATKGGFAIGGFGSVKAPSQDLFWVTPDSIRMYIDDLPVIKNTKGGFAIGGFDRAKASGNREYMRVTNDSTRINVNPAPAKGTKGGFAIGGFATAKGAPTNFMNMTQDNYFIGQESGIKNTTGKFNSFLGYQNGYSNTTGSQNVYLGYKSGYSNTSGESNTFIGNEAGKSNTASNNVYIGYQAGLNSTTGDYNIGIGTGAAYTNTGTYNAFIGFKAGYSNTTGTMNTFIGYLAGYRNISGYDNIALGQVAGYSNETGAHNVFLGISSGYNNKDGNYNIFIGESSGYTNGSGSSNIFLGSGSGLNNISGSYNLFLGVSSGRLNKTGASNIFLGTETGYTNEDGIENLFIGNSAGYLNKSGNYNIYIGNSTGYANATGGFNVAVGYHAGLQNLSGSGNALFGNGAGTSVLGSNNTMLGAGAGMLNTGSGNLFVGYYAGYNETGSNRLYINNSQADKNNALIYGEFDNKLLKVNGDLYAKTTLINNNIEVSSNATGNRDSYIDLHGDDTYTDWGMRIIRTIGGPNGTSSIKTRGTGEFNLGTVEAGFLTFSTSSAERMRITSSGYVGIANNTPVTKLDIEGGNGDVQNGPGDLRIGSGVYSFNIGLTNTGGGAGDVRLNAKGGNNRLILGGGGYDILLVTNADVVPWTDNVSSLGGASNRWTTIFASNGVINTSDARLKENISNLSYGLESILKLNPVSFTWKDDSKKTPRLGLIAQDVEKVISEAVDRGNDPQHTMGINYSELIPVLIKGMQQQQELIDKLQKEVDDLKARTGNK